MEFDYAEYAKAMDEFLLAMEKIFTVQDLAIQNTMDRLCRLLRIAQVRVTLFDNQQEEQETEGEEIVFYRREPVDEKHSYEQNESTNRGDVFAYQVFPYEGEAEWTETEIREIKVFITALFAFNGRARVMKIAEDLTFRDRDVRAYTLPYFMKKANFLIAKGEIEKYGACYFNLRRFSVINQQIGRKKGTRVIRKFVGQLQKMAGGEGFVCRIGGDNFLLLFLKENLDQIMEYMQGVGIVYDEVTGDRVLVSTSAGYYMISADECESDADIMDRVSVAIHTARNVKKQSYVFFNDELLKERNRIKTLESIFPKALEKEEFKVYYQPKVLLKDYKLAGAEALCRWVRDGKLVPPGEFIPILEQSQAICTLDFYMIEHVCMDIRRWLDEGRQVVKVSVNLSRRHLGDMDLLNHILSIVDKYQVPHEYIEIELTETTTDIDFNDLKQIVFGLRDAGIHTSVDDFGVGYSSLNLIRQVPWNVLKIDKSFLPDGDQTDEQRYVMLKYLIAMFQDMGFECIVEGVETVEQVKLLKENNCYLAQGYYFDRPLPVVEFETRLDALN